MRQYKTHVLCLLDGNPEASYHALDTILEPLDKLQAHLFREVGLTAEEALLQFNLAPLRTRRDFAMLAIIFKCAHGLAHDSERGGTQDMETNIRK